MKNKTLILAMGLFMLFISQTSVAAIPGFGWIKGSGKVVSETRDVSGFHGLEVGGAFKVTLIKSNKEKVVLEVDDNLLPYITTHVRGGILEIDNEKDFRNPSELSVTIYYKSLDEFDISGAASVHSKDILKEDAIEIEASGASELELTINTNSLEGDFSGASKVELQGKAKSAEVEASGASVYMATELETEDCEIDASGASVVRILVTQRLAIEASGASSLKYKGNPSIDIISISGASSVRKY